MSYQLPHSTYLYSLFKLHIHWQQVSSNNIIWTIKHRIQENGKAKTTDWNTVTASSNVNSIASYTSGTLNQITRLVEIDLSNIALSSLIEVQIARTDSTAGDIEATFIDAHIQRYLGGSRQEYIR